MRFMCLLLNNAKELALLLQAHIVTVRTIPNASDWITKNTPDKD